MAQGSKPETLEYARELRREQTPIEASLWRKLRAGQLARFKFRRQHPLGPYIVDFCCEEVRLILEIDGDSHVDQQVYDELRTAHLASLGYMVIRYTNRDVLGNMDGVLEAILGECMKRRGECPHPYPSPPGEGIRHAKS